MEMQFLTRLCDITASLKQAAFCLGVLCLLLPMSAHAQRLPPLNIVKAGIISQSATVTVVEYYIASIDSYFLTGRSDEKTTLDGLPASFRRTGASFDAYAAGAGPAGTEDYCRFYISIPAQSVSSHFYGRKSSDCLLIQAANLPTHKFEDYDFAIYTPLASGVCPAHAPLAIYRSFRPLKTGVNPNHRFTLSRSEYEAMSANGWAAEGLVMCAISGVAAGGEKKADVVRFLEQATLGPTEAAVNEVAAKGFTRWLNEQLLMNVTRYTQLPYWEPPEDSTVCKDDKTPPITPEKYCQTNKNTREPVAWEFYRQSKSAPDQLRLRMAHVWHQILVFGNGPFQTYAGAEFHQRLRDHALGTFEDLLTRFAISPQMGHFQNWVRNVPEQNGVKPNENFARELMQLFTIGVNKLNDDGTNQLDAAGKLIPTYSQADVETLARVLTGFGYPTKPGLVPDFWQNWSFNGDMTPYENYHDRGVKSMFGGALQFPANTGAMAEFKMALSGLVNHANTPAFISKQLIQKTVTAAPSPAYVARVAAVFKDNGAGVRGDLAAVTRAVLLDDEARGTEKTAALYGRLREPVLIWTAMIRALDANTDGVKPQGTTAQTQSLFNPETVFNYYPADYTLIGSNIPAPEFGLYSTAEFLNRANYINDFLYNVDQSWANDPDYGWGPVLWAANAVGTRSPPLTAFLADAADPVVLVERLNQLFLHGMMRASMRQSVVTAVNKVGANQPLRRVKLALNLVLTSVDYQVQK